MKTPIKSQGAVVLGGGLFISGCAKKQMASFQSLENPELAAQLKSFVAEKEAQANGATNKMPSEFQAFFALAAKGDWLAVSNAFIELRKHAGPAGQFWTPAGRVMVSLPALRKTDRRVSLWSYRPVSGLNGT